MLNLNKELMMGSTMKKGNTAFMKNIPFFEEDYSHYE
jgi:hypothetical protein